MVVEHGAGCVVSVKLLDILIANPQLLETALAIVLCCKSFSLHLLKVQL